MNRTLEQMKLNFVDQIKENKAVLGAWNFGSETHGLCDEYSDVDIILLIEGTMFNKFSEELNSYLKNIADKVLTCWPEGFNSDAIINNGYLIEKNGSVFQFDVFLINSQKTDDFVGRLHYTDLQETDVLFEKNGAVKKLIKLNIAGSCWSDNIEYLETTYWYHAFMTVKYIKRKDYFKLNNVLRTMFDTHTSMLLCGYDKITWGGAANKLHFIPEDKQNHLMGYYCSENFDVVSENVLRSMKAFQIDSKEVHNLKKMDYIEVLGDRVIENWVKEIRLS